MPESQMQYEPPGGALHWADEASLELIEYLLRHPPRAQVFSMHWSERPVRAAGPARFEVDTDIAQGDLSPSAHAALRAELDAVSARGRLVARAAAIVGDPSFDPSLVADVAQLPASAVLERMIGACGGLELPRLDVLHRPVFMETLVVAALAQDNINAAERWVERMEACWVGVELPGRVGHALLARARVRLAAGDPVAAAHGALAAAAKFTAGSNRFTAGRAPLFAGNALATIDRSRAFAEMGGAKTLFAVCGARRSLADAARAQRMLGGRASLPDGPTTTDRWQGVDRARPDHISTVAD